jgi:hypothetical protein
MRSAARSPRSRCSARSPPTFMNSMSTLLHVVDTMNPDLTQTDLANDSDTNISVPEIDAQPTGVSLTAVTLASGVWSRFKLGRVPGLELEAVRSPQHPKCELGETRPPSSGPESSAFSLKHVPLPTTIDCVVSTCRRPSHSPTVHNGHQDWLESLDRWSCSPAVCGQSGPSVGSTR